MSVCWRVGRQNVLAYELLRALLQTLRIPCDWKVAHSFWIFGHLCVRFWAVFFYQTSWDVRRQAVMFSSFRSNFHALLPLTESGLSETNSWDCRRLSKGKKPRSLQSVVQSKCGSTYCHQRIFLLPDEFKRAQPVLLSGMEERAFLLLPKTFSFHPERRNLRVKTDAAAQRKSFEMVLFLHQTE